LHVLPTNEINETTLTTAVIVLIGGTAAISGMENLN
jgi:hypothetical protein